MQGKIIHLESATEREPFLQHIRANTRGWTLDTLSASDGKEWAASPQIAKQHPLSGEKVSAGILGCLHSHMKILWEAAATGGPVAIFEDDCEFLVPQEEVEAFLKRVETVTQGNWDIILLGANEYVDFLGVTRDVTRVKRFWGTHAMILSPAAVKAAIATFEESQAEGLCLPADWLYNETIYRRRLSCYGPLLAKRLCRQRPGLVSAVNGKVRGA